MIRLILLVESRIHGNVYVWFGGEHSKTHRRNMAGRRVLSLLLAQRIRENGLLVLGCGETKTPAAFVNACKKFMFTDMKQESPVAQEALLQKEAVFFDKAFEKAANGNTEVALSIVGSELKRLIPKFKTKRYGCKTLGAVYQKLDKYELIQTGEKKTKNNVIRKKPSPQEEGLSTPTHNTLNVSVITHTD